MITATPQRSHLLLCQYFCEQITDESGLLFSQVLNQSDAEFEDNNSSIPWIFPLSEKSYLTPNVPVLFKSDHLELLKHQYVFDCIKKSYVRTMKFFGFDVSDSGEVTKAANFKERAQVWLFAPSANDFKITQMLKCLSTFGLTAEAYDALDAIQEVYWQGRRLSSNKLIAMWHDAVVQPPKFMPTV